MPNFLKPEASFNENVHQDMRKISDGLLIMKQMNVIIFLENFVKTILFLHMLLPKYFITCDFEKLNSNLKICFIS